MRRWTALAVVVAGCASTTTTTQWKADDLSEHRVHQVLTVGLVRDDGRRRALEDELAKSLVAAGVRAAASWRTLPEEALSRESIRETAQAQGADGILVVRFAGSRDEVIPMQTFDPYWGMAYPMTYGPVTYDVNEVVTLDARLFAANGEMLWSATSETIDPSDSEDVARDVAKSVTGALEKEGAIARAPEAG